LLQILDSLRQLVPQLPRLLDRHFDHGRLLDVVGSDQENPDARPTGNEPVSERW
jgi:hypothetical protein